MRCCARTRVVVSFYVMSKKKTTEEFVRGAIKVHGNKYDYSKVEYKNNKTKVCIICPEHGEFWQTPCNHLNGNGCPVCADENKKKIRRSNTEEFIEKAKRVFPGDKYTYMKVDYYNNRKKVIVTCKDHGDFLTKPNDFLHGHGCPVCRYISAHDKTRKTTEQFIFDARKIHGGKYDYSKVNYVGAHQKVCIICPEHGEFWQEPNVHLKGYGCPKCSQSHLETSIQKLLTENNIGFEYEKQFDWLKNTLPMSIDFYLPELKVGIECQGLQHFRPIEWFGGIEAFNSCVARDVLKNKLCTENGLSLLYYTNETYDTDNDLYRKENTFNTTNDLLGFLEKKMYNSIE